MGVMYGVDQSTGSIGDPVLDSSTGSGGGGGLTQEEHDALMRLAAYEPNMYDANPDLIASEVASSCCEMIVYNYGEYPAANVGANKLPVCGYKRINLNRTYSDYNKFMYRFQLADGSFTTPVTFPSNGWIGWVTIPENAICMQIANKLNSVAGIYYALSTSES